MIVNVKKLSDEAKVPSYAKDGDAGLDFIATKIISEDLFQITYGTDISIEIPKGFVGLVFPRSSIRKYGLTLSNSVGVIDSGYRGEIIGTFNKKNGYTSETYEIGDKIFQMIIVEYPNVTLKEVSELSDSERGIGGFGHTGK